MIKTEQQCTPQFPSLITWSTKLRNQGLILRYLNRYNRLLYGHNIQPQTLIKLAKQAGVPHEIYTLTQISQKRKEAYHQLRQIKKNHEHVRKTFLQKLYEEYATNDKQKAQKIIHTIMEREHIKKIHRNI